MLSKRVIYFARARAQRSGRLATGITLTRTRVSSAQFHSSCLLKETVKVPQMAESISEGTLKSWSKKVGDSVAADEEVATIETDKIDVTVNAPQAGKITELLANEEDTVSVGQDLFKLEPGEDGESSSESKSESEPKPKEEESKPEPAKESKDKSEPSDQQVEKKPPAPPKPESSVEKKQPPPKKEKDSSPPPEPKSSKQDSGKEAQSTTAGNRNETRVKLSRMRLRIAERLKQSQNTAASLTTFNEIDMSALQAFRAKYKEGILKSEQVKLGFMGLFAKAACLTLKEIPMANAELDAERGEIVYRDFVDLSVAVATPKGLVTPIVRGCEGMSVVDIEREISRLGVKAREGKLGLEDMNGGTFTISNGGVFGSLYGTPIINLPQAAVLGMHTIKDRPVAINGQVEIRPIMVVALTYDHRLLDGREAVTFLVKLKEYLEDPLRMLL